MAALARIISSRAAKVVVFILGLWPLLWLAWRGYNNQLTANPIEFITRSTGDWTLRFLLISLTITPLRRLTGQLQLIRFRRMIGLFAFFYASLHFTTYIWLDKFFDLHDVWKDVAKRPFITVGFLSFVLLIPLAITSTKGWIRRLGRKWQMLHRIVYVSVLAGVVHYYWLVKSDIRLPALYAAIAAILLVYRIGHWLKGTRSVARPTVSPSATS